MTNAEVFEKVFETEPDTNSVPFYCNPQCPSYVDNQCGRFGSKCHGEEWWFEEFNGKEHNSDIKVLTKDDCCEQVIIEATPVEWLVIHKALKNLVNNPEVHIHDKKVAERILNTEPVIGEVD